MSKLTYFCDLAEPTTPFPHFWEHTVGSDHARMALRADWQQQLKRAHDELGFRHVRFHGLLSDNLGTVVHDDLARDAPLPLHSRGPSPRRFPRRVAWFHAKPQRLKAEAQSKTLLCVFASLREIFCQIRSICVLGATSSGG